MTAISLANDRFETNGIGESGTTDLVKTDGGAIGRWDHSKQILRARRKRVTIPARRRALKALQVQ